MSKSILIATALLFSTTLFADVATEAKVKSANQVLEAAKLTHFTRRKSPIPKKLKKKWLKRAVPAVEKALKMVPEGYHIHIYGHTDTRGGKNYNYKLGKKRARNVYKALVKALKKKGIKAEGKLKYEGKGFKDLLDPKNPKSGVNRAVSLEVIKN